MKFKKKSLQLEQILWPTFIAFLIFPLCGIFAACTNSSKEIAKKALDSTVLLVMEGESSKLLGLGSGFFVDTNLIATNFHVIEGAARGTAKLVGQETAYTIEDFIAIDKKNDLAILQVSDPGIQPLPLGDSDTVEIGDTVYVAGNPKGFFEGTFSEGIISAIRGDSTNKRLQMTAPISSGSSGGPVLNDGGEVIGVSFATFRGGQNLNFAIPSNYLKELLSQLGTAKSLSSGKHPTHGELGGDKGAPADYDRAIQFNPNDAEAYLNQGVAKNKLGQYFAAITDFDTAIRIKPDYAEAYYNRGVAKDNLGQHNAANTDYDTAIRLKPDLAKDYLKRGNAKNELGLYSSAIDDYDTAIRIKPDYTEAYYNRGNAKASSGQHAPAINDYNTVIQLKPNFAEGYLNRGKAKENLEQHNAAIDDYDIAIQINPDYAEAYNGRGAAKDKLEQHFAAITDYDTAIRIKSDYAESYFNRGIAKDKLGQYTAAITDYDNAIKIKSDSAFYLKRGNAKYELGQYWSAIDDYDTAIKLNPQFADAYLYRGMARTDLGKYPAAAINDYDIAIQLKSDFADAYLYRGMANDKLGRTGEAKQDFQTALKLAKQIGDEHLKTQIESAIRELD